MAHTVASTTKLMKDYDTIIKELKNLKKLKQNIVKKKAEITNTKIKQEKEITSSIALYKKAEKTKQKKSLMEIDINKLAKEISSIDKEIKSTNMQITKLEKDKVKQEKDKAQFKNDKTQKEKDKGTLKAKKSEITKIIPQKKSTKTAVQNNIPTKEQQIKTIQDKLAGNIPAKVRYNTGFEYGWGKKPASEIAIYDNQWSARFGKLFGWSNRKRAAQFPEGGEIDMQLKTIRL